MGRKTWESLPRALPERQNIVVTRQRDYAAAGAELARFVRRGARPRPAAGARVLHRRRRALSRRPALCDDASPDGDRARLRRRRALSAVRARRLAGDRARRSPARRSRTDSPTRTSRTSAPRRVAEVAVETLAVFDQRDVHHATSTRQNPAGRRPADWRVNPARVACRRLPSTRGARPRTPRPRRARSAPAWTGYGARAASPCRG